MRTIKDNKDLKEYIYDLERENESLKKSHSYRVGRSLIDIKNIVLEKKFKNLVPASKKLLEATKKVKKSPNHVIVDIQKIVGLDTKKASQPVSAKSSNATLDSVPHYFIPKLKYKKVSGVFFDKKNTTNESANILLTPDNYKEVIDKANIDFVVFDLQKLKDNPLWFAFGTHDSIFLLKSVVLSLDRAPSIGKVLIENEDITLFPLLLKLKELGFFDITQSKSFVA